MVSKMVRSKKEWVCSACNKKYIKWQGKCQCGEIGTLLEHQLIAPKPRGTLQARSIRNRAKRVERDIAKRMVAVDGRDSNFDKIASSSGRVGFITNLQFDAVSKTYATEAKNRVLPKWLITAWIQVQQVSINHHKEALLYIEPPNLPKTFILNGEKHQTSNFHIITEERHKELIRAEQELEQQRYLQEWSKDE